MNLRSPLGHLLPLALLAAPAGAVGTRLPNQDPEGIARGNAFAATADNPSAIYYNPAGITQLEGHHASVGFYFISADIGYNGPSGSGSTRTGFQAVPQIHYVYSPADSPLAFGLGVYAPYGLGIDYGKDSPFPTAAREAELIYASVNPVLAWSVTPTLSLAAGVTLNASNITLERAIGVMPGDEFHFEGDGFDTGFNLGLLWKPHEQWSFGLNYRSQTEITYKGDSVARPYAPKSDTRASLVFPSYIVGGISYRPNENWNFEFNLDWTDWDSLDDAVFKGTFGGPQSFPFRYKSSFMYEFGATRQLGGGYAVSAGYIYSENSVPSRTFSPLNPDSNLHLLGLGVSYRGECYGWAVGYHFAYNEGRTITGNLDPTVDGRYETFNHAVNVSLRYQF